MQPCRDFGKRYSLREILGSLVMLIIWSPRTPPGFIGLWSHKSPFLLQITMLSTNLYACHNASCFPFRRHAEAKDSRDRGRRIRRSLLSYCSWRTFKGPRTAWLNVDSCCWHFDEKSCSCSWRGSLTTSLVPPAPIASLALICYLNELLTRCSSHAIWIPERP